MDAFTRFAITASIVAGTCTDRLIGRMKDDRGQASTEYAGILFVIVAIIAAVVAAGFTEVGTAVKNKIVEAVGQVGG